MKCINCNVHIDPKFKFAIKHNKCPACNNNIMDPEKLASYTSLQQLLKNNFPNLEVEKITNLVVANFEIKQLFKEEGATSEDVVEDTVEVMEDMDPDKAYDEAHKKKQIKEAKATIKNARDAAYEDALKAQYGMSDEDGENPFMDFKSTVNPIEETLRMVEDAKKQERHENMLSGAGGFRRSS